MFPRGRVIAGLALQYTFEIEGLELVRMFGNDLLAKGHGRSPIAIKDKSAQIGDLRGKVVGVEAIRLFRDALGIEGAGDFDVKRDENVDELDGVGRRVEGPGDGIDGLFQLSGAGVGECEIDGEVIVALRVLQQCGFVRVIFAGEKTLAKAVEGELVRGIDRQGSLPFRLRVGGAREVGVYGGEQEMRLKD